VVAGRRKDVVRRRTGAIGRRTGAVGRRKGVVGRRKGVVRRRTGVVRRRTGAAGRRRGVVRRRKGAVDRRRGVLGRRGAVRLRLAWLAVRCSSTCIARLCSMSTHDGNEVTTANRSGSVIAPHPVCSGRTHPHRSFNTPRRNRQRHRADTNLTSGP